MKSHDNNFLYSPTIGNAVSWFIGLTIMSLYVNDIVSSPWPMLVGILVGSTWTIWIHAYRQAEMIEVRRKSIDHKKFTRYRIIAATIVSLMLHVLMAAPTTGISILTFVIAAAGALYIGSIFWLEFDFFLNHHRELHLDYITGDPNGAKADVFFFKKKGLWIASKVFVFLAAALLYYWTLTLPLK